MGNFGAFLSFLFTYVSINIGKLNLCTRHEDILLNKGDVLLEFSLVKWVLNEDYSFNSNLVGTLFLQNFALVNSYFIHFFRRTNDCGDTRHTKKLALNKN